MRDDEMGDIVRSKVTGVTGNYGGHITNPMEWDLVRKAQS